VEEPAGSARKTFVVALPRVISRLGRPRRARRRHDRLVADLLAIDRMTTPGRPGARVRLEAQLGRPLVRELEQALGLEGKLRPRRRGLRRAA
jgi:hypothetical protein